MDTEIENASVLYLFKPPVGYRTSDQLLRKLRELKKKDSATTPSSDHSQSVPQLRYFAEYIQGGWSKVPEIHNPAMAEALRSQIQFQFYRNWAKVIFDSKLEKSLKAPFYKLAVELELVVIPE